MVQLRDARGCLSGCVCACFSPGCQSSSCSKSRRKCQLHTGSVSRRQECCCHLLELDIRDESSLGGIVCHGTLEGASVWEAGGGHVFVLLMPFPDKPCSDESQRPETGEIYLVSPRPSTRTGSIPTSGFQRVFFQVVF